MEAFNKESAQQLFKTMDSQEFQDPEKVSAMCIKNLNSIVNKMNNTKSLMIYMKPKDAIKLDIVELDKSEAYLNFQCCSKFLIFGIGQNRKLENLERFLFFFLKHIVTF